MKGTKKIVVAITLLLVGFSFVSCSDPNSSYEDPSIIYYQDEVLRETF